MTRPVTLFTLCRTDLLARCSAALLERELLCPLAERFAADILLRATGRFVRWLRCVVRWLRCKDRAPPERRAAELPREAVRRREARRLEAVRRDDKRLRALRLRDLREPLPPPMRTARLARNGAAASCGACSGCTSMDAASEAMGAILPGSA